MPSRSGMTLIEVIVVVAIVGVIASVAAFAMPRIPVLPPDDPGRVLAETRRRVLHDGVARVARLSIDSVEHEVAVLPDGSIVADTMVAIDRFTARWQHATH